MEVVGVVIFLIINNNFLFDVVHISNRKVHKDFTQRTLSFTLKFNRYCCLTAGFILVVKLHNERNGEGTRLYVCLSPKLESWWNMQRFQYYLLHMVIIRDICERFRG